MHVLWVLGSRILQIVFGFHKTFKIGKTPDPPKPSQTLASRDSCWLLVTSYGYVKDFLEKLRLAVDPLVLLGLRRLRTLSFQMETRGVGIVGAEGFPFGGRVFVNVCK